MWINCLVTLIAWIVFAWLERSWLMARNIPEPTPFGILLGIGAAGLIGSVDSLRLALRNRRNTGSNLQQWTPGTVVRTSGRIQARGGNLATPIQGQAAVAYTYLWTAGGDEERHGGVSGMDMGDLELLTPGGAVKLEGFPSLEHFPVSVSKGKAGRGAAARWLASRSWTLADVYFTEQQKRQQVALTLMNRELKLPLDIIASNLHEMLLGSDSDEEAIEERLKIRRWEFEERFIPPGMEVTVKGKYETNPPRIRVQAAMFELEAEVRPGSAGEAAGQELRRALLGIFYSGLLAGALHWEAYYNNANLYRWFLAFLAQAE